MPALAHGVGVAVGGGKVGTLLPILDATVSDPEERCPTQVDEQLFGVDEVGVAPLPVTRGDQIDVRATDLPGGIGRLGLWHRRQVAGPAHQPVTVTTAPMRLPGQPGRGRLRAVGGPQLAGIPPPDQPAPRRLQTGRHSAQGDDQLVQFVVIEGVDVEVGELVEHCFESCRASPPTMPPLLSNTCSLSQPLRRKFFAGFVARSAQEWPRPVVPPPVTGLEHQRQGVDAVTSAGAAGRPRPPSASATSRVSRLPTLRCGVCLRCLPAYGAQSGNAASHQRRHLGKCVRWFRL